MGCFSLAFLVVGLYPVATLGKMGVGLFAPDVPFADPASRFRYVAGVAQHLSATLGMPVEGRAYKSLGDFSRDVRSRRIQFAVVAALHSTSQKGWRILASARFRSAQDGLWSLMGKRKVPLAELEGKLVAVPAMGPATINFIQYGLLAGVINVKKYFRVQMTPDLTSAIMAVQLGRAAAGVVPSNTPTLTRLVSGAVPIPPPAFVAVDGGVSAEVVQKAAKAMMAYGAAGATLQGWQSPDGGAYTALAGVSRKRVLQMVMLPVNPVHLRTTDLLHVETKSLKIELPELEDLYWLP